MPYLDLEALASAPLVDDPFDHVILPGFVRPEFAPTISRDYPRIDRPGSFALGDLEIGGAVDGLVAELSGSDFRSAIEAKFGVDLSGCATLLTLRGFCGPRDGRIHTDSKSKLISILLYLNPDWTAEGGRLRLLRNGRDLQDYVAEAPPRFGMLVAFRRCDHSWHGHLPFGGPRRVLQMNWVRSARYANVSELRHRISAAVKRLVPRAAA
ncbi:MAG TPA: 2OG-Fe(II) oxygenase [Caulobacteraceae bacterium]|jgi:hypothetical protein|nr:2OG-Fe(II) oxygenase [Caulobacteraceae bacterium]